jgi:hypothetical protein
VNTDSKFVTCHCKSCSGGIEFERELFDPENPAVIECPHCGLETHLYIPSADEISHTLLVQESAATEKHKRARGTRTSLTPTQCASAEGQELIQLLCEITRAGLVTEEGVRRLNVWLDGKINSEVPAIKYLLQLPERIGQITTAKAFDVHFAIEHILPKNIRGEVKAKRQEAWLHSPLKPKATEAQLKYIRDLGGTSPPDLNIAEASLLIDQLLHDPEQQRIHEEKQAGKWEHEFAERERNVAYHLHSEFNEAKHSEETAEKGEIRDAKMYLKDAWNERLWFWRDTFRSPDQMEGAGTNEQPIKLYFAHGHRYRIPSENNIRAVLEALDAYSPTWDKDTPEYFFSTLQQNFPELLKTTIDFEELEVLREIYASPSQDSE